MRSGAEQVRIRRLVISRTRPAPVPRGRATIKLPGEPIEPLGRVWRKMIMAGGNPAGELRKSCRESAGKPSGSHKLGR